jgi:hypothetical protein
MLEFLYHIVRTKKVEKDYVYSQFFQTPFVKRYCEQEGIEEATIEAAKHRCPFLLNILEACGVVKLEKSNITVLKLLLMPCLMQANSREDDASVHRRLAAVEHAWPVDTEKIQPADLSILRELFGASFLTSDYHITTLELTES